MDIIYFGSIDPNNLNEYYDSLIEVSGSKIEIDLNFESTSVHPDIIEKVPQFLNEIEKHIKNAFAAISYDFDIGDQSKTAKFYLEHHLKIFSKTELDALFGTTIIDKKRFIEHLKVQRIGFYPEDERAYVVIDIKLPDEYTNYTMAVTMNDHSLVSAITMES